MNIIDRKSFVGLLFVVFVAIFAVQQLFAVSGTSNSDNCYTLVERTDLRRYDNNVYTGLVSREVRSLIRVSDAPQDSVGSDPSDTWYDGFFYVTEQTKRAMKDAASGIHDSIPAVFHIRKNGHLIMYEDHGYPSFRSFPSFPKEEPKPGDSWSAPAERAVDPLNKGIVTKIPMLVAYTFVREEQYHGEAVYRLTAKWATRYGTLYTDPSGDQDLQKADGSHTASILVNKATGNAELILDQVNETFVYSGGKAVTLKGTITLFTEYPPAVPRDKLLHALGQIAEVLPSSATESSQKPKTEATVPSDTEVAGSGAASGSPSGSGLPDKTAVENLIATDSTSENAGATGSGKGSETSGENGRSKITVENTAAGLRLSIQDLQFVADSAELLPGEKTRLDKIADVLKLAPDSQFLVEGHTASTGKAAGELKLSEERAHSIADELVRRGIPADKFICRGWGAKRPVADNDTPKGRARNRRVEITIVGR